MEYEGPRKRIVKANNLKLRVGSKTQLWNKVMKEVKEKGMAGPYKWEDLPVKYPHQSPLGLVPKQKTGGKESSLVAETEEGQALPDRSANSNPEVRLIFHLSHPPGESINDYISEEKSRVKYHNLDEALSYSNKLSKEGANIIYYGSCDLKRAFRNLGIRNRDKHLLTMMAEHPITKEKFYFMQLALPFGCRISPKFFRYLANPLHFWWKPKLREEDR